MADNHTSTDSGKEEAEKVAKMREENERLKYRIKILERAVKEMEGSN
jgi:hypothetical protein